MNRLNNDLAGIPGVRDHYRYLAGAQLSKHFTAYEFVDSTRYPELVVVPPPEVIRQGADFANDILEPYRELCCAAKPVKINSWYRNHVLNARVGGVENSVHQIYYNDVFLGVAADTVPSGVSIYTAMSRLADPKIMARMPQLRTVIIYPKNGFIHIDTAVQRDNVVFMVSMAKGKYEYISQDEARDIVNTMKNRFKINVSGGH